MTLNYGVCITIAKAQKRVQNKRKFTQHAVALTLRYATRRRWFVWQRISRNANSCNVALCKVWVHEREVRNSVRARAYCSKFINYSISVLNYVLLACCVTVPRLMFFQCTAELLKLPHFNTVQYHQSVNGLRLIMNII